MVDYEEIKQELRKMEKGEKLYEIVKAEMVKRGRWKNKPRGKPTPENLNKN